MSRKKPIDASFEVVKARPRMGAPSMYSEELAAEICRRMSDGKSLREVCREPDMPCMSAVLNWLRDKPDFVLLYTRAREALHEHWAQQIIEISDTPVIGIKTKTTEDGVETIEGDMIEHRRLQVDARKWILSKLAPRKYGDRVEITGNMAHTVAPAQAVTAEQAESAYSEMCAQLPAPTSDTVQ